MKKILILIAAVLMMINMPSAHAGFFENKLEELQIRKLILDLNSYSNKHDLERIRSLYSEDFKSGDGFNYDDFFKMVGVTFDSYKDIKYRVKIKNIQVNGNKAEVKTNDRTTATLESRNSSGTSLGDLRGDCDYIVYLKKQDGKWKITSDYIISESTALKYGDAKGVKMHIIAPQQISEDSEYSINLKMNYPKDIFVIASLNREEIVFPPSQGQESFRKLSPEGSLERIVRSNKDGMNEYAIASIGFTRLKMGEDLSSIKFQMSGLAFLMSRVNVEMVKVQTEQEESEISVAPGESWVAPGNSEEAMKEAVKEISETITEQDNNETPENQDIKDTESVI